MGSFDAIHFSHAIKSFVIPVHLSCFLTSTSERAHHCLVFFINITSPDIPNLPYLFCFMLHIFLGLLLVISEYTTPK